MELNGAAADRDLGAGGNYRQRTVGVFVKEFGRRRPRRVRNRLSDRTDRSLS